MAGVVRNPGLGKLHPILPVSNPTSLEFHMGLFANIAAACTRAFSERGQLAWTPSAAGAGHLSTPPPLPAPAMHPLPPLVHEAPPPSMRVNGGHHHHHHPTLHSALRHPLPVIKLRASCEHDGQPVDTRHRVRMVISGRMADVCAELERLAALENRVNTPVVH